METEYSKDKVQKFREGHLLGMTIPDVFEKAMKEKLILLANQPVEKEKFKCIYLGFEQGAKEKKRIRAIEEKLNKREKELQDLKKVKSRTPKQGRGK